MKVCCCFKNRIKSRIRLHEKHGKQSKLSLSRAIKLYETSIDHIDNDLSLERLLLTIQKMRMDIELLNRDVIRGGHRQESHN